MSDEEQTYPLSPEYMAVDPSEHACDACSNPGNEPIARIEEGDGPVFICARCAKAVVGLLRGLGLTS